MIGADSLYTCKSFFDACKKHNRRYIVRFKEGGIPTVFQEHETLRKEDGNRRKGTDGKISHRYDFVSDVDYEGHRLNRPEYAEDGRPYPFVFLTNLPLSHRNARETVFFGRCRQKIENEGFNAQKNHGFFPSHLFSWNCHAMKNHYYLIRIARMIAQITDAWKALWEDIRRSKEQKHRRILESWKTQRLSDCDLQTPSRFQIQPE